MSDPTEGIRSEMVAEINAEPGSRAALEAKHGQVWDTDQLQQDFEALGFMAPLVVLCRRSDGVRGSLSDRFLFGTATGVELFETQQFRAKPFRAQAARPRPGGTMRQLLLLSTRRFFGE